MTTTPLESVVRPFQSPQNTPTQIYLETGATPNVPIRLEIGRGSGGKIGKLTVDYLETLYMDAAVVEVATET